MLDVESQEQWLEQLGAERVAALRAKAAPDSWRADAARATRPISTRPRTRGSAPRCGARATSPSASTRSARDAVLAGAGVANLSAWLGVQLAQATRLRRAAHAEIGLWGYDGDARATRSCSTTATSRPRRCSSDAQIVLGALVGGPGTTTIGCLGGAQIDRIGNMNSTWIPPKPFLVGSGGGNDVASTAAECVVVATLTPARTPERCGYITSPGASVRALVTDLGTLEKRDGELVLTAVPAGDDSLTARIDAARAACGWDLVVADDVGELSPPETDEVAALRRWDPQGWFLRA